jgi:hypothetical protein
MNMTRRYDKLPLRTNHYSWYRESKKFVPVNDGEEILITNFVNWLDYRSDCLVKFVKNTELNVEIRLELYKGYVNVYGEFGNTIEEDTFINTKKTLLLNQKQYDFGISNI